MRQVLQGWNKVVRGEAKILLAPLMSSEICKNGPLVPRGAGQSYGDASLNFSNYTLLTDSMIKMEIEYLPESVFVSSNLKIKELCAELHSKGRFLETVPGSEEATIGGCIASDVHGKNDRLYGSFGHSVIRVEVCDQDSTNWVFPKDQSFAYIVSGYGLTGIITRAEIRTRKIPGQEILTTTTKTYGVKNLFIELARQVQKYEYAVGWLDLSFHVKGTPRGYVEAGDWATSSKSKLGRAGAVTIPDFRINFINPLSIKVFNSLTFFSLKTKGALFRNYEDFLFPTRKMRKWNNLFGKTGFHEIQVLISDPALDDFIQILEEMRKKFPIFLVGVKRIEKSGLGCLSFTSKGWSVAMNIPGKYIDQRGVLEIQNLLFNRCKAPQYLTKDASLDKDLFNKMYPQAQNFREFRKSQFYDVIFESEMSKRLGL